MDYCHRLLAYQQYRLYHTGNEYLNFGAVFSDETGNFVSNPEPNKGETVGIMLRGAKDNIDEVRLYVKDAPGYHKAHKCRSDGLFDYYEARVTVYGRLRYCFAVIKDGRQYYYNKRGLSPDYSGEYDFTVIPDFQTPDWAKGAVIYQIFVDRFYNGDHSNDVRNFEFSYVGRIARKVDDWGKPPEHNEPGSRTADICSFYGGDLAGVIQKMDYLKELGVDVIYFSPLFVSPSSHKYDTQDYDHIDPHIGRIVNDGGDVLSFGKAENAYATKYMQRTTYTENLDASNRLMAELVETAHQKGIKVIVDGVFNHCSHFNRWMDREGLYAMAGYPAGAYSNDASEYKDYFGWLGTDAKTGEKTYDSWWGHSNQPKLNYEGSEALYDYMIGIGGKWVAAPYNFDGWRLDMAADLGHSRAFNIRFWADFRKKVKEMNADACIWSEHYGDATDWLGTGWDALMSYDTFMEPVTWFFTGMQKHSEETKPELMNDAMAFENSMRWWGAKQSIQPALLAMNQLSNHDHSRFLTRTNMRTGRLHTHGEGSADVGVNRNVFMEATVMLMTWMGCPTLYYGDEAGVCGWTDPDNRRTYPWGKEDRMLLDFHHAVIRMRKANPALRKGSQEYLYMNYGVISYARWEGGNTVIAVFNNTLSEKELLLPVWKAGIKNGILTRVMATGGDTFDVSPIKFIAENGMMKVVVGAQGSMVFSD